MRNIIPSYASPLLACLFLIGCNSDYIIRSTDWRDPGKFENAIRKFETADVKQMPPENAVLFVGSSSIRMWHKDLPKDFEPVTVIGRGFGGSNTNDMLHFADRIVIAYKPRAVVIYEGDNDIAQGIKPYEVRAVYEKLLDKIEGDLPGCRVYILAVKPSIKRWEMWPKMEAVNEDLAELAEDRDNVIYIDISTPMLDDQGQPRADLFVKDNLHLNRKGYELWRDTIRPIVVEAEKEYE
ncbi:MAG: SGNH/GDSL hydrolase family protein [Planctomycetota bacterium]